MKKNTSIRKMRIMAIDDSKFILELVTSTLNIKYDVFAYDNGVDAINAIRSVQPDLILLDYEMPNMNGLQIIKWIRENRLYSVIPVIFLTAYQDVQFELQAFELGAVDYIHKPFTPQLLQKRIEMHLSQVIHSAELTVDKNRLEEMVNQKTATIKELQNALIFTLSDIVEMRDHTTGGHIQRTVDYYRIILNAIKDKKIYQELMRGLDEELLLEAVQLHDIGKVAIPDAILLKPSKLNADEFDIMKTHAEIGHRALLKAMKLTSEKELLNLAAVVALTHHERWDGTGYPNGLKAEAIPLIGRIMAIVDVYDAILSKRPYKEAMTHEEAVVEIINGKGTHFDPVLADLFLELNLEFKKIDKQ